MNEQQDKNSKNEPIEPPAINNSLPQNKVVSDIIPEQEKSLLVESSAPRSVANTLEGASTMSAKQKSDFNVLTAAPNMNAINDNSGSILLGTEVKKPFNKVFILAAILFLIIVGFAAAYYSGVLSLPFLGLTHEQVIGKMFDAIPGIRSGRYGMELNFKSEARQPGMQGYNLSAILGGVGGGPVANVAGERDVARFNAISDIEIALDTYKKENGKYPQFLNDIKLASPDLFLDPATKNQYGYRQEKDGMDFTLHIQMETIQGINSYRAAVLVIPSASLQTIEDKLAEIHADTPLLKKQAAASIPASSTATYDPTVVLQNLPSEVDVNLRFSGLAQLDGSVTDAKFDMDGSLKLSGMSFLGGVEIIKKGDTVFGKIKEAPSFGLFDLATIKGKWVRMEKTDLSKVGIGAEDTRLQQESQRKFLVIVKTYLRILKEEKVLSVVKELPKAKNKDGTFYRYAVSVSGEKTAAIYEKLNADIKKEFGVEDAISADLIAYLRGSEYAKMDKIAQQNTQMELWIDTKNFWPYKFTSNSVFVPPDNIQKLKDKQYRALITFDLFDVNKAVSVEAPTESISVTEAEKLVVGK